MKIDILFRCDFGRNYGFGHIMRCISLSQAFVKYRDINLLFFTTCKAESLKVLFDNDKVTHIKLPKDALGLNFDPDNFAVIKKNNITIFDNYDVTFNQMENYRAKFQNLIAIDDIADRNFDVDIIINQNIGSKFLNYRFKKAPRLLLGEKYALLRQNVLNAKKKVNNKNIFMSFGGGEVYDRIKKIFDYLLIFDRELYFKIKIDFIFAGTKESKNKILNRFKSFENIDFNFI